MARVIRVPVGRLTAEAAEGFGMVIRSLDDIEPVIRKGAMVKERMEVRRQGDELYFKNHAVDDEGVVGKLVDGAAHISFVNCHGDATQAFIGADRKPTVFLLAKPSENPRPEDFVGFYSDGSLGMSMFPDVWHTSPLPVEGSQEYENTQGNQYHHATLGRDFSSEGVVLEVALEEPQDQ